MYSNSDGIDLDGPAEPLPGADAEEVEAVDSAAAEPSSSPSSRSSSASSDRLTEEAAPLLDNTAIPTETNSGTRSANRPFRSQRIGLTSQAGSPTRRSIIDS